MTTAPAEWQQQLAEDALARHGFDLKAMNLFINNAELAGDDQWNLCLELERAAMLYKAGQADHAMEILRVTFMVKDNYERVIPLARIGLKFGPKGRGPGIFRKRITAHLKRSPNAKNADIWAAITSKLPKGWEACDNRVGKYLSGPAAANLDYHSFQTICSQVRRLGT